MTFEWPMLLIGLALVPILLMLYLIAQRRRRAYAVRFTNLALLGQVMGRGPGLRRHLPPLLFLLGMAVLLVSLARPSTVIAMPRDQVAIMLVMDVSGSMVANDLKPDRMQAAKTAAHAFVNSLPDNQLVGLVSFNATASTAAPLTDDHALVAKAIDGLYANGGTAIGEGLNTALDQLARRPTSADGKPAPALVVLLSDGASSAGRPAEEVAQRAKSEGILVHTVGIGQRGASPLINGRLPARLDESTLQAVATTTGGTYFYAAETPELKQVYTSLGSQISWVEEKTEVTALFSALGTFVVMVGALLSLGWFQKLP